MPTNYTSDSNSKFAEKNDGKIHVNWIIVATIIIGAIILFIWLWVSSTPPRHLGAKPKDLISTIINSIERKNAFEFHFWSHVNIIAHISLICLGVLATIFAGITHKDNIHNMKVWSVLTTSLTAAIGTGLGTFHVHRSLETFIQVQNSLRLLEAQYDIARGDFKHPKDIQKLKKLKTNIPVLGRMPVIYGTLSADRKLQILERIWPKLISLDARQNQAVANIGWQEPSDNLMLQAHQSSFYVNGEKLGPPFTNMRLNSYATLSQKH